MAALQVLTITMNPALDKSTGAKHIEPTKKIRCDEPVFTPGGGGVNVSRAIKKLGGVSTAWYLAGGSSGDKYEKLVEKEGIKQRKFDIPVDTRENVMVYDKTTSKNYRFGMPGPNIDKKIADLLLDEIQRMDDRPDYIVASGSLPRGIPVDFYRQLGEICSLHEIKLVLDTSGEPLKQALKAKVFMLKPNLRELATLAGKDAIIGMEQEGLAKKLLDEGRCENIVLSLGAKGAMFAQHKSEIEYVIPPTIPIVSTVGAGDSMIAGIMMGLMNGYSGKNAVQYGTAAGTAATMTPGAELCKKEDTEKIFNWIKASVQEQ